MRHVTQRCAHCQASYSYQSSGHGCGAPLNDGRYCPDCKQVILTALAAVPRKFERVLVDTTEVTLEQVLEWDREQASQFVRRIAVPMFRLNGGPDPRTGFVKHSNRTYYFEFTPGEEDKAVIRVEMEKELATGRLTYW